MAICILDKKYRVGGWRHCTRRTSYRVYSNLNSTLQIARTQRAPSLLARRAAIIAARLVCLVSSVYKLALPP